MVGVVIGRFQPFHNNHKELTDYAMDNSRKVLIIVGSAFRSRLPRNPFTFEERKGVISQIYPDAYIAPCEDFMYDSVWGRNIVTIIKKFAGDEEVCIYGKPEDIEFNKKFLRTRGVAFGYKGYTASGHRGYTASNISGTAIREILYKGESYIENHYVPKVTQDFLLKFDKAIFKDLAHVKTKNRFNQGIYSTVDNIVVWKGQILLVRRKDNGLYALPGGYLEKAERVISGALRELKEETGLEKKQLIYKFKFVVDNIHRSGFGRLISFVYVWKCDPRKERPEAKAGDDAEDVVWADLNNVYQIKDQFHDDHYQIINHGGINAQLQLNS